MATMSGINCVRENVPIARVIYLEPDLRRPVAPGTHGT